ncbi:13056_t:CDS:2, partial [Racocetra persica]
FIAINVASNLPLGLELEKLIICARFTKNIQEQKDLFMRIYEKSFTDYMVKHPDIFDKYAEIEVTANYPFKIFTMKEPNILPISKTIKVPTLLIHSEDNNFIPIKKSELLACEIPNNKFILILQAGY